MGKRSKEKPTHLYMSPAAIERVSIDVFGDAWRAPLCEALDISYSQLHRYMTIYQGQGVPKTFAMALTGLAAFKAADSTPPDLAPFRVAIKDAEAVKFVQVKKEKPAKVKRSDAPDAGLSFGDDEPEAPTAPPEPVKAPVAAKVIKEAKKTMAKATAAAKADKPAKAKAPAKKPAKVEPAPVETKAVRDARIKREKRAAAKAEREKADA